MSPEAIVFAAVKAPWINKFPLLDASKRPQWEQAPQLPLAVGKSTTAELSVVPPLAASKLMATLA
jgi:hypothetical protein